MSKQAIIIGAGPAGLTAAYELLKRTDIIPVILEKSGDIGGISKTVNYKGNRIDIGGHRFFSKSDRVMNWWFNIMPVEAQEAKHLLKITYQQQSRDLDPVYAAGTDPDKIMLVRKRLSRIYFLRNSLLILFSFPWIPCGSWACMPQSAFSFHTSRRSCFRENRSATWRTL